MTDLTKETAQRLFDNMGEWIFLCENHADQSAKQLEALKSKPETGALNALKGILRVSLIIDFINLDVCAAYRQYLSTELSTKYEKRQAMTKINIIMSEGYKKIYGFNNGKESYWGNQIKTVVDFISELEKEYKEIEAKLNDFGNNNILNKDMRDLAVHYDTDPIRVYKMLSELNAEEVTKRFCDFYKLLKSLMEFIQQLSEAMALKIHIDK